MDTSNHPRPRALLVTAAGVVLGWRAGALLFPSAAIDIDDAFRVPLALLGLLFLGCGIAGMLRARNGPARVFLLYCFGSAIHWGGAIAVPGNAELPLLSVYIAVSALAGGAFLHLGLVFPRRLVSSTAAKAAPYAPAAAAILLLPASFAASTATYQALAGVTLMFASILSFAGGVALILQYVRQRRVKGRRPVLRAVVFGGLTSTALALAGSGGLIPGLPEAWSLLFGVLPVTLAFALGAESPRLPATKASGVAPGIGRNRRRSGTHTP